MIDTKPQVKFCSYCGTYQEREGKYCFACGSLIKFAKDPKSEQTAEIEREPSHDKLAMKKLEIADKIAMKKEELAVKRVEFAKKMEVKKAEMAKKMAKKKEQFNKKMEQFSKKVDNLFK